jgi:hypothetical protein
MRCFPQQGADLGALLLYVFKWTHERQFERTIVTSSDAPQISTKEILPQETGKGLFIRRRRWTSYFEKSVFGPSTSTGNRWHRYARR